MISCTLSFPNDYSLEMLEQVSPLRSGNSFSRSLNKGQDMMNRPEGRSVRCRFEVLRRFADSASRTAKNCLEVYSNRRVLSLFGLGFSSGLPYLLTGSTLQAWMTTQNVDLRVIGIFALVGFPYTLKFLWAPLMDRFALPWLGRRRGWILLTQILLAAVILLLGASSPTSMPWMLASLAVMVAFFSASQDIVVDAYRTDVLRERELGAGAATAVTGYRIALLVSGGFAFILADHLPWRFVYGLMAAIMLFNTLFTMWAPEPAEVAVPPKSLKEAVWGPLASYFHRPGAVEMLLFIVVYKLSDNLAGAMTTPFLLGLGFSLTDVGMATKFLGLASTILGALAGGSIISRIGINRSLWIFAFLQAVCHLSFTWLALVGKSYALMVGAIAIENLCGGMGTAAFTGFMMSLCDKRFSATQYALLTSLMALGRIVFQAPTGFMVQFMGWPVFYTVSLLGAVPAILLLPRFAPWNSREMLAAGRPTGESAADRSAIVETEVAVKVKVSE